MRSLYDFKMFCESLTAQEELDYYNQFLDDLNELFFYYVEKYDLTTESAKEMFKPGSDFLVEFIVKLEDYPWFDYTKLQYFLKEWDKMLDTIDDMREEGMFETDDQEEDDDLTY
jgi:hypothetical protein